MRPVLQQREVRVSSDSDDPKPAEPSPGADDVARLWPDSIRRWLLGLRSSRLFWVRVGLSLTLIVVSMLTNRSFLGWGLFVIFAIMLVPIGRARSFLISF